MHVPAIHLARVNAADLPLEQLAGNPNLSNEEKISEAARQFESVLLRQMLSQARKPLLAKDGGEDANTRSIYDDMVNNQLADGISKSGELGLAHSLRAQLIHQILPGAQKATPAPPLNPASNPSQPAPPIS